MKITMLKNILLLLFSVFLCFFFLEIVVRVFYPVINVAVLNQKLFVKDEALGYVLKPNADLTEEVLGNIIATRTNTDGLRNDADYNKGEHPGIFRILGLGDSVAYGFGVNIEDSYLKVLERNLNSRNFLDGIETEVINVAFPGWGIAQELIFLKTRAAEYKPDLVIMNFVDDDIFRNYKYYSLAMSRNSKNIHLSSSKEAGREVFSSAQNFILAKTKFWPFILSKARCFRNRHFVDASISQTQNIFLELNEFCRDNGASLLVVVIPLRKNESWVNDEMIEFFGKNDIAALDLRKDFSLAEMEEVYLPQDNHPNARGHELIAVALCKYFKNTGFER